METFHHLTFYLTVVFLQDEATGDVTAFYAQFPDATAQGRNAEEAKNLLNEVFPIMMEDKQKEFIEAIQSVHQNPFKSMTIERQKITA